MCMANQKWDPTMNLATEYAEKSGQNSWSFDEVMGKMESIYIQTTERDSWSVELSSLNKMDTWYWLLTPWFRLVR